jgi:exopolyphosphatase/guanosine-5'-triphosphate,3'-diphosphate pyrophosphatase
MKLAAIDVGSNAVRLLLSRVIDEGDNAGEPIFKKESLIRIPIRLGDDVFTHRHIPEEKIDHLVETMIAFRHLIRAYDAVDFAACATSAMREAANGHEVVARIRDASGIELDIVDGRREAEIIVTNSRSYRKLNSYPAYLHIDVGGGSTEMTVFTEQGTVDERSFNIGTIRILNELVSPDQWKEMKKWLKSLGDNRKSMEGQPLTLKQLKNINETLAGLSVDDRIRVVGLRPDRADVIVPAAEIFISIMKWANIKQLYVPQVGLADGLVQILYRNQLDSRKDTGNVGAA